MYTFFYGCPPDKETVATDANGGPAESAASSVCGCWEAFSDASDSDVLADLPLHP